MEGLLPIAGMEQKGLMEYYQAKRVGVEEYVVKENTYLLADLSAFSYQSAFLDFIIYTNSHLGLYNEIKLIYGVGQKGVFGGKAYKLNDIYLPKIYHDNNGKVYVKFITTHFVSVCCYSKSNFIKVEIDTSNMEEITIE